MKTYITTFISMLIVVIAAFALTSDQAPSFTLGDWISKLPGLMLQMALFVILLGLIYFGWRFGEKYYQSWSRNKRHNRSQHEQPMSMPRSSRLNVNQLFQAYVLSQMGFFHKKSNKRTPGWWRQS